LALSVFDGCGIGNGSDIHCWHGIVFAAGCSKVLRRSAALGRIARAPAASKEKSTLPPLHRIRKRPFDPEAARNRSRRQQNLIRAVELWSSARKPVAEVLRAGRSPLEGLHVFKGPVDAAREKLN